MSRHRRYPGETFGVLWLVVLYLVGLFFVEVVR